MSRVLSCVIFALILAITYYEVSAQAQRTATPITVSLVTVTPLVNPLFAPTVTIPPSASPQRQAAAEAPETAGNINVRAEPSLEGEILGTISHGTVYPVFRRYYSWYELGYDPSPSGRAWVYGDLVEIQGDESTIESVENYPASGAGPGESGEDEEAGGSDTRIVSIAATDDSGEEGETAALPTFTRPPELPNIMPVMSGAQDESSENATQGESSTRFPPLFPIVVLSGLGLIGLLVNSIRG